MASDYRFSFGPWNIHEGADPFGPPVRPSVAFAEKLPLHRSPHSVISGESKEKNR